MLAEYNLPFPSPLSSLDEELDWLGTSDDLLQLDVNLVQVLSDDEDTSDRLYPASNLSLFLGDDGDEDEAAPQVGVGQQGVARGKPGAPFGSPGSDYFANAYLAALRDSEGIGGSEALLGSSLLQTEANVQPQPELSDSDDSSAWSSLTGLNSSCPASPTAKRKKLADLDWSEMDGEERERTLEVITEAVREYQGLRDQLELLRLVGQDMTVLPTDSRFRIDPANMDDAKLKSVHSFLSQMARHTLDCGATKSPKESRHTESPPRHKKSVERRSQHKIHRKRRTKEKKQNQKERRSGLFDQEVVLSLQIQDDDNREINILD